MCMPEYSDASEIDEQIVAVYLDDAYEGRDPDWAMQDSNANIESLLKIAAVLRDDSEAQDKIADIRSIVYSLQARSAASHLRAMSDWK